MHGSPHATESITHGFRVSPEIDAGNVEPFVKRDGINWISAIAFTIFHIGAIAALFFFSWPAFLTAVTLYWVSLSFGIGMAITVFLPIDRIRPRSGSSTRSPCAEHWRWKVVRSFGWPYTGRTTSLRISMAILTRHEKASGGRTSSGCWLATRVTAVSMNAPTMHRTWSRIVFTSGCRSTTTCHTCH